MEEVADSLSELQALITTHSMPIREHIEDAFSAPHMPSGRQGRPGIAITRQQIKFLMGQGYTVRRMAQLMKYSASFLYKRTRALGLPIRSSRSSSLTNEELEHHIRRDDEGIAASRRIVCNTTESESDADIH
ncbi:hypothetical protein DPEC_G00367640 [Dallia pectoralis]|nr:hypothetical protein DPEC_G00367630 [Dallia pectoralis]KAJ7984030.1 hypothetical protein DPEC_G00367640 [Dallia pectoralis]